MLCGSNSTVALRLAPVKLHSKLPPVVSDWQQCQQPRCSHYFAGECCNSDRPSASAPCRFDGRYQGMYSDDADFLEPSVATQPLPKKNSLANAVANSDVSSAFISYLLRENVSQ